MHREVPQPVEPAQHGNTKEARVGVSCLSLQLLAPSSVLQQLLVWIGGTSELSSQPAAPSIHPPLPTEVGQLGCFLLCQSVR